MSFLKLDIVIIVDYYINFIFAGYINVQIRMTLYYFKRFYVWETFKRKRWYVVEEEQQTINVGILNKFFVQYHLTIGQTPYVKQQLC